MFCIDTCAHAEELKELADSIQQILNLLPDDSLVGLITFGTNVQVHELGFEGMPKSYVIRGNKEYAPAKVGQLLGCGGSTQGKSGARGGAPPPPPGQPGMMPQQNGNQIPETPGQQVLRRFLLPVSECSMTLESILEDLRKDPWPVASDKRVARCTGCAFSVATSLLDLALPRRGARVMMFVGGPCTSGPGAIVSRLKTDDIRSHADLARNAEPLHKPACEFYASLAGRHGSKDPKAHKKKWEQTPGSEARSMHVVDVFACALDQVGMLEMGELVEKTGGHMVSQTMPRGRRQLRCRESNIVTNDRKTIGPRRLLRTVGLQRVTPACFPDVRAGCSRGWRQNADGLRGHDGGSYVEGV